MLLIHLLGEVHAHPALAEPHDVFLLLHQQIVQTRHKGANLARRHLLVPALGVWLRALMKHVTQAIVDGFEILYLKCLLMLDLLVLKDLLSLLDDPLAHPHDFFHVLIFEVDDLVERLLVHINHLAVVTPFDGLSTIALYRRRKGWKLPKVGK